jgi:hypothetical protein
VALLYEGTEIWRESRVSFVFVAWEKTAVPAHIRSGLQPLIFGFCSCYWPCDIAALVPPLLEAVFPLSPQHLPCRHVCPCLSPLRLHLSDWLSTQLRETDPVRLHAQPARGLRSGHSSRLTRSLSLVASVQLRFSALLRPIHLHGDLQMHYSCEMTHSPTIFDLPDFLMMSGRCRVRKLCENMGAGRCSDCEWV